MSRKETEELQVRRRCANCQGMRAFKDGDQYTCAECGLPSDLGDDLKPSEIVALPDATRRAVVDKAFADAADNGLYHENT